MGVERFARLVLLTIKLRKARIDAHKAEIARIDSWLSQIDAETRRYPDFWENLSAFFPGAL